MVAASRLAIACTMLLAAAPGSAQERDEPAPPDFVNARVDEDYAYLRNSSRRSGSWWESFKFIPIANEGRLTLGGDLRLRYERYRNNLWGGADQPNDAYGLMRLMSHADLQLGSNLRLFGQLVGAWSAGVEPSPGPVDETRFDLLQSFTRVGVPITGASLFVQGGRQLLSYGSERLVGLRYGPNVPLAFDGGLARLTIESWKIDTFFMRPVENNPASFDDRTDGGRKLWSIYATRALPGIGPASGIDLFYIGYGRKIVRFDDDRAGPELRHTLGARLFGSRDDWKWDVEGHLQFGRFAGGEIRAWSVASDIRYTFSEMPLKPFLQLRANAISGDQHPDDRRLGTFNALFPKGKYFGEAGQIGPYNLLNIHPIVGIELGNGLSLSAAAIFFWRESVSDGIYGNVGNLLRASGSSRARFVGTQGDIVLGWSPARGLDVELSYSVFRPGRFIEETGSAATVQFLGAEAQMRF